MTPSVGHYNIFIGSAMHSDIGVGINLQQQSLESAFFYFAMKICHFAKAVGFHCGTSVLNHHHAVFVVNIGQSKRLLWQIVEEFLLGGNIGSHGFVKIEVVVGYVAKNCTRESKTSYALLHNG